MLTPLTVINREAIDADVKRAVAKLGPEVLDVSYTFEDDWVGEPSIYFRVTVRDESIDQNRYLTSDIRMQIVNELNPLVNWGLHPYVRFQRESDLVRP